MRQAAQPTEKQLEQGYELVPVKAPTNQPNNNARLNGATFPAWESEEQEANDD